MNEMTESIKQGLGGYSIRGARLGFRMHGVAYNHPFKGSDATSDLHGHHAHVLCTYTMQEKHLFT